MASVDELQVGIDGLVIGEVLSVWRRGDRTRTPLALIRRVEDVVVPDVPDSTGGEDEEEAVAAAPAGWPAPVVSPSEDGRRFEVTLPTQRSCDTIVGLAPALVAARWGLEASGVAKHKRVATAVFTEAELADRISRTAAAEEALLRSLEEVALPEGVATRCVIVWLPYHDVPLVRVESELVSEGAKRKVAEEADAQLQLGRLERSKEGGVVHVQYVLAEPLDPTALGFALEAASITADRLGPMFRSS